MSVYKASFIELVALANLAPSSHNCQPWSVNELSTDVWEIQINTDRKLKGLQAHTHEMLLSLGSFIAILEGLLLASDIPFCSELVSQDSEVLDDLAYRVTLGGSGDRQNSISISKTELISLLEQRFTDRGRHKKFDFEVKTKGVLNLGASANNISVSVNDSRQFTENICAIVKEHGWMEFTHSKSWRELYSFIDFSHAEGHVDKLGFNIQQLIGPASFIKRRLYAMALNPWLMPLSHYLGLTHYICRELNRCILSSQAIVVVSTAKSLSTSRVLGAGKALADMWLSLVQQGLVLHPLSILLQHDVLRRKFEQLLPNGQRALFVARIGLPVVHKARGDFMRYRKSIEKGVIISV